MCFITHDGGTHVLRKEEPEICIYGPIVIGCNTFIGARSLVLPNVKIGNNVIVGAGSIVTKSVPDDVVVAGVPARVICTIDEYRKKNDSKFSFILHLPYEEKRSYLVKEFYEN